MILTAEEENKLCKKYLPIIYYIWKRLYKSSRVIRERDEIFAEGRVGLVYAIKTYQDNSKVKFSTYAYRVVKNRMLNYIREINSNLRKSIVSDEIKDADEVTLSDYMMANNDDSFEDKLADKQFTDYVKTKVISFLNNMNNDDKMIFTERLCGKSFIEIGNKLGYSKQNAQERFEHTVGLIKKYLKYSIKDITKLKRLPKVNRLCEEDI